MGKSLSDMLDEHAEDALGRSLLPRKCLVMCGEHASVTPELRRLAMRENAFLHTLPEDGISTAWLAAHVDEIDVLLVDADYLGDIEDTVDFCLRVRRAAPNMPIILISSEIRGDDFTCERMQACDVTLKTGFSERKLETAIHTAYDNNAYFLKSRA